jgi:hypothetical protein
MHQGDLIIIKACKYIAIQKEKRDRLHLTSFNGKSSPLSSSFFEGPVRIGRILNKKAVPSAMC